MLTFPKGMDFFSFEEDLIHHIDQAMVVVSSGLGTGFFQNPYTSVTC